MSDARLQMSSVVIGFAGPPREPALGVDLIKAILPFQPTTTRTFTSIDSVRIVARSFLAGNDGSVNITLRVRGLDTFAPQQTELAGTQRSGGRREALVDVTLPLRGMMPGAYALELAARLPNGQSAMREVPFRIAQ